VRTLAASFSDLPIQRGYDFTTRVLCTRCGTIQELTLGGRGSTCGRCSPAVAGANRITKPAPARFDYHAARFRRTGRELAALTKDGPGPKVPGVVVEILAFHNRLTSLAAFVPFVGPWLVAQSETRPDRKLRLQYISIGLTTLTIVGILALLRALGAPPVPLRERLQLQIQTLGDIAEDFRAKHSAYPDSATWRRTAEQPDPRFFDPWSRVYRYEHSEDGGVTIGTLGRDGKEGGTDEDADVSLHFAPPRPLPDMPSRVESTTEQVVDSGTSLGKEEPARSYGH
jgi:Type II secretion system (T2SS), protein G